MSYTLKFVLERKEDAAKAEVEFRGIPTLDKLENVPEASEAIRALAEWFRHVHGEAAND